MNPNIERLAKAICHNVGGKPCEICMEAAKDAIFHGWIHKDEAINYVVVCPGCQGSGQHERGTIKCLPCQGWGVVKEDYCKHSFMEMCDFSKFSNAHNSKKCVKCGLVIKKNG